MTDLQFLLPDQISPWLAAALVVGSALTSMLSAAASIGGGSIMLAIFALILPQPALIPVHGVLQLGSNFSRCFFMRAYLRAAPFVVFAATSIVGAVIGGLIVLRLPQGVMIGALGLFILWSVWGRIPAVVRNAGMAWGGLVSSILTMFVGATGPFVGAVLRPLIGDRLSFVAVHAACMVIQHTIKLIVFAALGFAYGPYVPLIAVMIASGFLGSYLGKRILVGLTDDRFHTILKLLLTLVALRLLWTAVGLSGWA